MATMGVGDKAQITARAGVARAGTCRAAALGNSQNMYLVNGTTHLAGEFKYTETAEPTNVYTNVAKNGL